MLKCSLLEDLSILRHGFFTRNGGVSDGIYASLNCGEGSADKPAAVTENRRRAAATLGLRSNHLLTLNQVHSAEIVTVTERDTVFRKRPEADAMVTKMPGIALGILTADCAPILFVEPGQGIIGAAHVGWKGALRGVIERTVSAIEDLGGERKSIVACIGPCIAQASYQVGEDFLGPFVKLDPSAHQFFRQDHLKDKYRFDLRGYAIYRLENCGVISVGSISNDTFEDERLFFSYRRTCHQGGIDYGRALSAIVLAEPA